jgi:hypothetical protein
VPRAGFANHFADCLGDAAKDPELKAVFADVHAREADPRQKDAVVPPNPRHLLDHLSQLDRADRVVGVVQSAMQPYELKSTVSQYLRRQGIPGVVGYIDDDPAESAPRSRRESLSAGWRRRQTVPPRC